MYVIGELINGMYNDTRNAIEAKDKGAVQQIARKQLEAGADALDINVGPARGKAVQNMLWLIESVQEVTDAPLCIDSAKYEVMVEALKCCKNRAIINSTKAIDEQLEKYVALALEHGSQLVALTIDETGVPSDVDGRVAMGATIVTKAMEGGLRMADLYIDAVILPVNVAPKQPYNVLQALQQLRMLCDPAPNFILGLSNVSQNCAKRSLLNSAYAAMAIGAGLNAAILDPLDEPLMHAAITAEVLMEKQIYCDDYIAAYMSGRK